MQWNVNEFENWEELRPYVDTALLPLYLYKDGIGVEEHVLRMNYLLNIAAGIEQRLKGRVLLFPLSYQFAEASQGQKTPRDFAFSVGLHFSQDKIRLDEQGQEGCLMLPVGEEDLDSALRFEVTVDVLVHEIIRLWQRKTAQ
ncbi:DUF2487 family protein [Brevibacillus parabrevis]|uniref:DUF2487 domain-containing protein n=1 Tax=Brevibacillus parabrevis TaxID=54914 RepID=A0A4Y3PH10_BREPA|nr:DUF2487 family protein [Brevibacillus parabrevis]RNB96272.1 DUF2487 family protein [Brevibacillus parabrevis]GEB32743.1 hypothetical protein BPA01_23230 [Brevibacillus parabrevis]